MYSNDIRIHFIYTKVKKNVDKNAGVDLLRIKKTDEIWIKIF